jgi:hypothetical protein
MAAVKVVENWKRWSDGFTYKTATGKELHVAGCNISNVFILGSGLFLVGAWVGAQIIEWVAANQVIESALGGSAYIVIVITIVIYAKYVRNTGARS